MSTRFGRKPGGYVWAVIQPLGMILIMAMAFAVLMRTPALGTSFILFKGTGLMVFNIFRIPSRMVSSAISYSRSLLSYPGVTWVDAVLARFLLNTLVMFIVTFLILSGIVLFEGLNLILDWGMIIAAVLVTAILAFGVGVFNTFMSERFDIYDTVWNILTAPLMIVSGIIFLYDDMPSFAQDILWYNPLIHVVGMMRAGFYSVYRPEYVSVSYVLLCAMIPMVLGLILMRRHHRELLIR
ncbi:MAG: ABC transporter permease [Pararhodobacter sp.]|nr:ABC transporter permease [Pararhodobacter sp.]